MMKPQEQTNSFLTRRRVNLDIGFRCTLECPMCARQQDFKGIRPIPGKDLTIEEYQKIIDFFPEVTMCGQISDPIFNPNFPTFIKMSAEAGTDLKVNTAASQRKEKWYNDVFDSFGKGGWVFGIDGLPEESHKYRINQDGVHLFNMMKLCASKGIQARWQYIVFRYNENHIDEARSMAKDIGVQFEVNLSSRFNGPDDPYRPLNPKYWIDRNKFAKHGELNVES